MVSKGLTSIAAVMAILGIGTWRRDFVGKRKIELAEETLERVYQAADAIRHMRSPAAFAGEMSDVVKRDDDNEARHQARLTVAPLWKRYNEHAELFASLRATRYKFMARFGRGSEKPFHEVQRLANEILIAANMYVGAAGQVFGGDDSPQAHRLRDQQREREEKFWDHGEEDPVNKRLNAIVEEVERHCRAVIERQTAVSKYRQWWPFNLLKS